MKLVLDGNLEQANPVLPVRWCLEPKDRALLRDRRATLDNAYILFVILDGQGRETRQLAPLDRMMEYLEFHRPGTHRVFAQMVTTVNAKELRKHIFSCSGEFDWDHYLLDYEKTGFRDPNCSSTEIEVVVPADHFPKEPPAWLQAITDWGSRYPAVDQCQFRRRMLFSPLKFALAGIIAVLTTVIRLFSAILVGAIFTLRGVNYRAILHPWGFDLPDVWKGVSGFSNSWLFHKKHPHGGWYITRKYWALRILLYPPVLLAEYLTVYIVHIAKHVSMAGAVVIIAKAIAHFLWVIHTGILGLAAGISVILLLAWLSARAKKRRSTETAIEVRRAREAELARQREQEENEILELVSCSTVPMVASYEAIPPARRTFYLRYHNLKSKVCRPFAR